jgi:hypothetical protein
LETVFNELASAADIVEVEEEAVAAASALEESSAGEPVPEAEVAE